MQVVQAGSSPWLHSSFSLLCARALKLLKKLLKLPSYAGYSHTGYLFMF